MVAVVPGKNPLLFHVPVNPNILFCKNRYSGNDLKNAACYDRGGLPKYSASIHSMIGAMVNTIDTYREIHNTDSFFIFF